MTCESIKYADYSLHSLVYLKNEFCQNCINYGDLYKCKFEKNRLFQGHGPAWHDTCSDFKSKYDQDKIDQAITIKQLATFR